MNDAARDALVECLHDPRNVGRNRGDKGRSPRRVMMYGVPEISLRSQAA
jgi:hypothetical protein